MTSTQRKVALVTGGAKRIGKAIARHLAAHGFAVAIHCHSSQEEGSVLAEEIKGDGGEAVVVTADLTNPQALETLVPQVREKLGPLQLLINNASIFNDDAADDFEWQNWDAHFAVHLKAPVALTRAMATALPEPLEGMVVNIIDQRVHRLNPRFFSYTLSKSALWTATQTMAQAYAPRIRINAIGPGPTLKNNRQEDDDFAQQVDAILLQRGPELSEFGATIRYLWEARSVTGQMIAIDGGQHLAWQTPDAYGVVE
jgi:NAD(P)-dependent dehydrogenase (short-subunit alcohol dehydrogenase family)